MDKTRDDLFSLYKKRFKRKQLLWDALSISYTLVLIPLMKFLDGTDYSTLWRIISIAVGISLYAKNIMQSRIMKRQLEALSENTAEKISSELESCKHFRSFAFTSEYLFSEEGMILPYYEIEEVITKSYASSPVVTTIVFKTRSFGKCSVQVGYGYMNENFYDYLSQKCPNAELHFRATYQKADMEEYFDTVRAESINVIRKNRR